MNFKLLDLFAGIGGFSLAGHWHGWQTSAFVEKDEFCRQVLAKNFPSVPVYDDIFTFSGKPFRGKCDVLTAGFPCQPFSTAGLRGGVNDERYLFPETLRIISEAQPTWILLENVDGLVSMANDSRLVGMARQRSFRTADQDYYEAVYTFEERMLLEIICREIENQGYEVQPIVIPVSALGAVHERYRVFIIAHADAKRCDGRRKRGQINQREIYQERRNNRTFGKSAIRDSRIADFDSDSYRKRKRTFGQNKDQGWSAGSFGICNKQSDSDSAHTKPEAFGKSKATQNRKIVGRSSRTSSNSDSERQLQPERRVEEFRRRTRNRDKSIFTDSDCVRLEKPEFQEQGGFRQANGFESSSQWGESWQSAALRTCVRSLDDGISRELVRPAGWNRNAIKAAGNSVSPPLVYEIFQAIKEASK